MTHDRARTVGENASADAGTTLDLTDDTGRLADNFADENPEGVAALLSALDLADVPTGESPQRAAVLDLAIYRATGSTHLAEAFCREFRPCR